MIFFKENDFLNPSYIMEFKISVTSNCYYTCYEYLSENIKKMPILYISDDPYDANNFISKFIKKYKISEINTKNSNIHNFLQENDFIYFVPSHPIYKSSQKYSVNFISNMWSILSKCFTLNSTDFFLVLNLSMCNFSCEEICLIQEMIKNNKKTNSHMKLLLVLNDYGESKNFDKNFFGEEGLYEQYKFPNIGEAHNIYNYLKNTKEISIFNELPFILQVFFTSGFFQKNIDFMFKNGYMKKRGELVIQNDKSFFRQYRKI